MIRPDTELGERAYEPGHMAMVLKEINSTFPNYFKSFSSKGNQLVIDNPHFTIVEKKDKKSDIKSILTERFQQSIEEFEKEHQSYLNFFDLENLEEYEDDPNNFKKDFAKKAPIMKRCLNSEAKEMKRYKSEFNKKKGRELLNVTKNIIRFGHDYVESFDESSYENINDVNSLGLSELLNEKYTSYQVIGGGIKSNFLYSLFPHAFPYRSQNAIWAFWYLTNKLDFGFPDGSEFLMVDLSVGKIQQNYHYPYDLFSLYALKLLLSLKTACAREGITFKSQYRYVYLDTFLNHIVEENQGEIDDLKKTGDYEE